MEAITIEIIIIILTISYPILVAPQLLYNYPFNCKKGPKMTLDGLTCPLDFNTFNLDSKDNMEAGTMCRPNPLSKDIEDGFLCYKDTWVTTCEETWYFSKTVKNHIIHEHITKDECFEALATYKLGKHVEPFFPAPSCYWSATNEERATFVNIQPHGVLLDPYSGKIKDPLIDSDNCDNDFCVTRSHQTHWLRNRKPDIMERCNNETWECHPIKIYYGWVSKKKNQETSTTFNYVQTGLVIESQYIGHVLMADLCIMTFCNRDGYLFPDGSWWEIKYSLYHAFTKDHTVLNNAHKCGDRTHGDHLTEFQRDKKVGYEDLEINLEGLEMRQKSRSINMMCLNRLAEIRNTHHINVLDMSYLTPKHPGRGLAYYFSQDQKNSSKYHVKVLDCDYKLIHIHDADIKGFVNITKYPEPNVTILGLKDNLTFADLGISRCQDLTPLNGSRNISCEESSGPLHSDDSRLSNGKRFWTRHSFQGANFHEHPGVRIGVNGITYDIRKQILRFPSTSNLLWDLPSYYSTKHRVHFFQHPTKHEIRKNFTGSDSRDIDVLDDLINRHINRTDFPTRIRNWIGNIEDKVEHFFSNVGGTIKTIISLVLFVIGTLISIKVWKKCKRHPQKTKKVAQLKLNDYEKTYNQRDTSNNNNDDLYETIENGGTVYSPFHV
ncbi:virion transmembrane glycoprotein G [Tibrogargan virus]|uniref:Glycoprotein n=1 Tax=Tibrogargan virus (strain CS132) TaxID=1559361 RepID=GLYCO_TIBVC|nr:virion transmembrane glycoprotein G [Tibrogargan virus]D8V075.1 RecName: Full=Glycoprotein; Flags: Precursor [Tibrogargan virus strain CS132]ADG86352.1 virion transmembrane glycoprotein G [Tibrogargan virus]